MLKRYLNSISLPRRPLRDLDKVLLIHLNTAQFWNGAKPEKRLNILKKTVCCESPLRFFSLLRMFFPGCNHFVWGY